MPQPLAFTDAHVGSSPFPSTVDLTMVWAVDVDDDSGELAFEVDGDSMLVVRVMLMVVWSW